MKLGRKNEAIKEIAKALEIKPNYPEALAYLGEINYEDKKYDKAIELFQKCIAVAPDYKVPYQYLGTYYYYIKYDNMKYQYYWNQYCQLSTHIYIPYE